MWSKIEDRCGRCSRWLWLGPDFAVSGRESILLWMELDVVVGRTQYYFGWGQILFWVELDVVGEILLFWVELVSVVDGS